MHLKIEYLVRKKMSKRVAAFREVYVSEEDIMKIAREKAVVSVSGFGDVNDSANEYELSDFSISEITGLR